MYATKKMIPATIGVAGLALTSLVAMGSAPASAVPTCQLSVDSIKVLNLQDNNANDEIFAKLGRTRPRCSSTGLTTKRFNIGTEAFQGTHRPQGLREATATT